MIKPLKPNTLPYPGCKIYPDYSFCKTTLQISPTTSQIIAQLQSWIPISRDGDLYLVPFDTSFEGIENTGQNLKSELLIDLEFHVKEINRRYVIQDNNQITIYKYGNNSKN